MCTIPTINYYIWAYYFIHVIIIIINVLMRVMYRPMLNFVSF